MTTPINQQESIIITLDVLTNMCFSHYMMGFEQAQRNLGFIGQQLIKSQDEIKQNIMKAFCEDRDKAAIKTEGPGEVPEIVEEPKKEGEQN